MALIERLKHDFGQTGASLQNTRTKEQYSRVYGGLAHCGPLPGCVVVVGELFEADSATGRRPYCVLFERSENNPSDLVRAAASIARSCQVECFFGDDTDRPAMELMRRQPYKIRMVCAPYVGDASAFESYLLLIRERTNPSRKLLYFRGSALPGVLSTIRSIDVTQSSKALVERWPSIAALGYAVSALETRNHSAREDFEANQLNMELLSVPSA